jgi:hypothetical protein
VSCDTATDTGELWCKVGSMTSSTQVWITVDGTSADYAVTATYGRNAVWDRNYNARLEVGSRCKRQHEQMEKTGQISGATSGATGKIGSAYEILTAQIIQYILVISRQLRLSGDTRPTEQSLPGDKG